MILNLADNRDLIEKTLRIRDKRQTLVPFKLNLAQAFYWSKRTRRNLILKARQEGLSKIIDADQLIECVRRTTNAVVISHEKEATKRLFAAVRGFIDNAIAKPAVSIDSKSEIQFPKAGSSYFIGTAGQKAFGRGDTVQRAHLSEAAFYPDLERILNGIAEAAEYGQIDIETTPNGREQFYDIWQAAKRGQSSFTPIFIPWFMNREYSSTNLSTKERNGLSATVREMFEMPDDEFIASYTEEEKRLIARILEEYDTLLTPGEIKWRRYKIWDRGAMFFQEYPEDDVSCFLQTGRSVFSQITTDTSKRIPLDNIKAWNATDAEKKALKERRLFAGVDGAEGTLTGDAHCFAVIDVVGTKAHVIYEHTSNEPIDVFCNKVANICKEFNIQLYVEKNGIGGAHVLQFRRLDTRFTEYTTSATNRPVMISDLEEAYRKGDLIETYPEAENEARDMIYTDGNRAEHPNGKHDDRIFARAIAYQSRMMPAAGVTFL